MIASFGYGQTTRDRLAFAAILRAEGWEELGPDDPICEEHLLDPVKADVVFLGTYYCAACALRELTVGLHTDPDGSVHGLALPALAAARDHAALRHGIRRLA